MRAFDCQVQSIQPLTNTVLQVMLALDEPFDYQAGQYIEILNDDEQAMPYSIANAPLGTNTLELHIGHAKDNPYSLRLLETIRRQKHLKITGPHGDCGVHRLVPDMPIIFMAGGTGFAPVKAMLEQLMADSDERAMHVFWGAKSLNDLYAEERLAYWDQHIEHFHYTPFVAAHYDDGKKTLSEVISAQFADELHQHQMILAGAFDMVYKARDAFLLHGLERAHMFSDAFAFE